MSNENITNLVKRQEFSKVDDIGVIFLRENSDVVYRGIKEEKKEFVRDLLNSGLVEELVKKGFFPETKISSCRIDDFSLVLEHKKIGPLSFPFEWSPSMLRDTALLLLNINDIASKYGYELKDAHPYNILFNFSKPIFVDFGSFTKKIGIKNYFIAGRELKEAFLYPLYLYSIGLDRIFSSIFLKNNGSMSTRGYWVFRYKFLRLFPLRYITKLVHIFSLYRQSFFYDEEILRKKLPYLIYIFIIFLKKINFIPFLDSVKQLRKKFEKINLNTETLWGDYHQVSGFYNESGDVILSERMSYVVQFIKDKKIKKIIELAGNQGVLSREIAKLDFIDQVICSDYDEQAIDQLYNNILKENTKILPIVLNFMLSEFGADLPSSSSRFKSDLVIALAVTHHLLLRNMYSIEVILDKIFNYSDDYVIVEFMPLGLFDGVKSPPLPEWYTREWFISHLEKRGVILDEKMFDKNRLMFICKKN